MSDHTQKPNFAYVTYIAVPAERIWEALTNAALTTQYFFGQRVESEWKTGAKIFYYMPDGKLNVSGTLVACEPPRYLEMTWHVEWIEELKKLPPARISFSLEPAGETTRLTVTEYAHENIPEKYREGGKTGWPIIMSGLKSLLETGRVPKIPTPEPPK